MTRSFPTGTVFGPTIAGTPLIMATTDPPVALIVITRPAALTVTTGTTSVLVGEGAFATEVFLATDFFLAALFLTADRFLITFLGATFFLVDFFFKTFFATFFLATLGAGVAEYATGSVDAVRENTETIMAALESNFFTPPLLRVHPRILGITRT